MTAATISARQFQATPPADKADALTIADLVLLRVAAAPATRAELQRDLITIVAIGKSAGTAFRQAAELAIGAHAAQHLLTEARGRLHATDMGRASVSRLLPGSAIDGGWDGVRKALVARALGISAASAHTLKALDRVEGLAAMILQQHFGIPGDRALSPTNLRAALAVIALERAFGNKIKTGLGKGLPGKAGRALAGQLFASPRDVATDGKLIVALATDIAGATEASHESLMIAALRRLTSPGEPTPRREPAVKRRIASPAPDNDALPLAASPVPIRKTEKPDMAEFAGAVLDAARPCAQGWPGARKAFISLVWQAIRNARPDWGLSETAFKSMLAEAHRAGEVVLASADLKDRCDLKNLEDSKILYKNTVWHFVRVED